MAEISEISLTVSPVVLDIFLISLSPRRHPLKDKDQYLYIASLVWNIPRKGSKEVVVMFYSTSQPFSLAEKNVYTRDTVIYFIGNLRHVTKHVTSPSFFFFFF